MCGFWFAGQRGGFRLTGVISASYTRAAAREPKENKMRVVSVCFALVVVSSTFVPAASAQSLDDNEHYQAFRSWAIHTQQPDPLPNMFKFCIQAYDKMIASGVSPSTRVPEDEKSRGTVEGNRTGDQGEVVRRRAEEEHGRCRCPARAVPRQPQGRQAATRHRRDARGCHVVCVTRRQIHQRCKEARCRSSLVPRCRPSKQRAAKLPERR